MGYLVFIDSGREHAFGIGGPEGVFVEKVAFPTKQLPGAFVCLLRILSAVVSQDRRRALGGGLVRKVGDPSCGSSVVGLYGLEGLSL